MLSFKVFIIVLPLVFLAAAVDSISGGGGLISLPAYTLAGLDYSIASGTNKFSAMFGTVAATLRYAISGRIRWLPSIIAGIAALPGSYIGTRLAIMLGTRVMTIVMVCLLPLVAVTVLIKKPKSASEKALTPLRGVICAIIGFVVGAYDGFFGPGTGTFLIILFTWVLGMDMVTASATAKPVNLLSNLASLITRIAEGQVLFALAIPATAMSILGGYVGSKLAVTRGARLIKYVMLGVLALLMVTLIINIIKGI